MGRLDGKVAMVTGGSQGLGKAIALAFAAEGARVAVASRNQQALNQVAQLCGEDSFVIELDVSNEAACGSAVEECVSNFGQLDVLVNCAGLAESAPFLETDTEMWRRLMAVDVDGPFWLIKAALPGMLSRGAGAVVSVASLASRVGYPYIAAYVAAKHALLGLTRALAAEYAPSGVTFNSVCPWYVDTPMTERTVEALMTKTGRPAAAVLPLLHTPQRRLVQPEEVAEVCLLLASDPGRGINGQAINIDGGKVQS